MRVYLLMLVLLVSGCAHELKAPCGYGGKFCGQRYAINR